VARPALLPLLLALALACGRGEGPQPIVWDREPCAHCRMLISEPRFAAQLETASGEVQSFDDPGCLLSALDAGGPRAHRLWFHHVREDRWLDAASVAFEPASDSPMGFGLGAVDAGAPGALSLDEARRRVAERAARSEDGR
jgi:copper chaperone NosL